jgi:hypothetical protein
MSLFVPVPRQNLVRSKKWFDYVIFLARMVKKLLPVTAWSKNSLLCAR